MAPKWPKTDDRGCVATLCMAQPMPHALPTGNKAPRTRVVAPRLSGKPSRETATFPFGAKHIQLSQNWSKTGPNLRVVWYTMQVAPWGLLPCTPNEPQSTADPFCGPTVVSQSC
uniref:Uncharacterized protein n=1 Tax=Eutreptiella gymnastica TaxID=73025 RepID=A0A7S1N525_9EUGL